MSPRLLTAAILAAGLALRLLAIPGAATSWDEVDFLDALDRYELADHAPHFPGYPLYVLSSRLAAWVLPAMSALALPGIALSLFAFWRLSERLDEAQRRPALLLLCACPLAVTEAGRPMADSLALGLGLIAATELDRRPWLAALLLGLLPGVKADHGLLWALLLLRPRAEWLRLFALTLCAAAAWLLPFIAQVGWETLWLEGRSFTLGHFARWGGAATVSAEPLWRRPLRLLLGASLGAAGLAGPLLLLNLVRTPRAVRAWALALAPLLLYLGFAQNLDHPRHLLLLLPALVAAGPLQGGARARGMMLALLLAGQLAALAMTPLGAPSRPVVAALAAELPALEARLEGRHWRLYVGESQRRLARDHPRLDIRRARDLADLERQLAEDLAPPQLVLCSPEVARVGGRRIALRPVASSALVVEVVGYEAAPLLPIEEGR